MLELPLYFLSVGLIDFRIEKKRMKKMEKNAEGAKHIRILMWKA